MPTGDYVLTENTTGASEDLTVFVNTLTTVVVVNYVEPEGDEPATIDVLKYTCEAGFQGSLWADFAAGCVSSVNLTNKSASASPAPSRRNASRATPVLAGRRPSTASWPATISSARKRPPAPSPSTPSAGSIRPIPSGRAVGNSVGLRLAAGQTVTCHWFNVPEDLTSNTGALTVYKFACPVTTPPANFDWYARCDPQGQGVGFNLSLWDGAKFVPVTTAATDSDGILRFTRLQPGTYDLKEVNATWCHAESDSVDAQGHVVVAAGKRASVWIFNCVGAKRPPNTGAGPLWSGPGLPVVPRPRALPSAFSGPSPASPPYAGDASTRTEPLGSSVFPAGPGCMRGSSVLLGYPNSRALFSHGDQQSPRTDCRLESRMSVAQRITEAEYEHIVATQPDHQWELVDGQLREKPGMTWEHSDLVMWLGYLLLRQLDKERFRVFAESRVRRPTATIFMPDVLVVPTEYGDEFRDRPGKLAIFSQPLPLVVEIWSCSTGDYDVEAKNSPSTSVAATSKSGASTPTSEPSPPGAASPTAPMATTRLPRWRRQPGSSPKRHDRPRRTLP